MERVEKACLIVEALSSTEAFEKGQVLTDQFVAETDVAMLSVKSEGMTKLIFGMTPPADSNYQLVDFHQMSRLPRFRDAFASFFGPEEGFIRVVAPAKYESDDTLELVIPRGKLKWDMHDYFKRIFFLSLTIAIITGGLIYFSMLYIIIRPIEQLAQGVSDFRENPEIRRSQTVPAKRRDEIGQLQRAFFDMKQSVRASFQQRERLALLGMGVAKINHDLRNILTSAQLVSDRLASDKEERIAKMGERLNRSLDRGVKLTAEVLEFSTAHEGAGEFQDVRISFLLGEVAGDVLGAFGMGARKISFKNRVPTGLSVRVDPDHTYRIFHNLFRNAGQALAGMADDKASRQLHVRAEKSGETVKIYVMDTGPGLPEKAQENIFKAFSGSTGRGNTGLGLTISKELAEGMGGDLVLDKTGPGGTTFLVTLPAVL